MPVPDTPGVLVHEGVVQPEWIDINGHMNVAYYVLAFDKAVDDLLAGVGVTDAYIRSTGGTTFAVECHVTYQRELTQAAPYRIESQILAYDEKRIHQFQRMYHATGKFLAATAEWMNLHVDLGTRKVTPWPAVVLRALGTLAASQADIGFPREAGRKMTITQPVWTGQAHGDR